MSLLLNRFFLSSSFIKNSVSIKNKRFLHTFESAFSNDATDAIEKRIPKSFKPFPFEYHEEIELEIEELTNLGVGIGRVEINSEKLKLNQDDDNQDDDNQHDNKKFVVFVPRTIPGEIVRARIFRNFKNYSEADLLEVISERKDIRITPKCEYFSKCGGCQYQHMNVNAQREWKRNQVESLMQRIGGINDIIVNPPIASEHHFGYRTKITPHYNAPRKDKIDRAFIGFQQRGTRNIIDIDKCIIATEAINEEYSSKRINLKNQWFEGNLPKKGATLLFRECEEGVSTDFKATISQQVGDKLFKFRAGEFFQNNAYVLPLMVEHVLNLAQGDDCTHLVDTYCGSGLFAISGAHLFNQVSGVEVSELAIKAAQANADLNNIENAEFLCASSEAIFGTLDKTKFKSENTVVIIDPPRKGCDEVFLNQLFEFNPKKLVYVSCDPATQARDTAIIVANGYKIQSCTPFDLFPQTRHIENVIMYIKN